jgi:hypothetical protein
MRYKTVRTHFTQQQQQKKRKKKNKHTVLYQMVIFVHTNKKDCQNPVVIRTKVTFFEMVG